MLFFNVSQNGWYVIINRYLFCSFIMFYYSLYNSKRLKLENSPLSQKKFKINGKTVIFYYPLSCIFVKVMYNGETEEEYHEIEKSFR